MTIDLPNAIADAKRALVGESNDAEHQALADLVEALGQGELPDCECEENQLHGQPHAKTCPCYPWQNPQ